jgi:hypothetical protein
MGRKTFCLAVIGVIAFGVVTEAVAQQGSCESLWIARNSIYKARGYCFKTTRAINYFGNAGCIYDNEDAVPLTQADRAAIAGIQAQERALGCQD